MARKGTVITPGIEWTEQDWLDLYRAMEWVKRRVLQRHGKLSPTDTKPSDSIESANL